MRHNISVSEKHPHTENHHSRWDMKYNLSMPEIYGRYILMAILVIIGGVIHHIWVQLLSVPVLMTAVLGWDPFYQLLGINHAVKTDRDEG